MKQVKILMALLLVGLWGTSQTVTPNPGPYQNISTKYQYTWQKWSGGIWNTGKLVQADSAMFSGIVYVPTAPTDDSSTLAANTKWIKENVSPGLPGQPTSAWQFLGNYSPSDPTNGKIGFIDSFPLNFITDNQLRLSIPDVGINRSAGLANKVLMIDTVTKKVYYSDMTGGGSGSGITTATLSDSLKGFIPITGTNDHTGAVRGPIQHDPNIISNTALYSLGEMRVGSANISDLESADILGNAYFRSTGTRGIAEIAAKTLLGSAGIRAEADDDNSIYELQLTSLNGASKGLTGLVHFTNKDSLTYAQMKDISDSMVRARALIDSVAALGGVDSSFSVIYKTIDTAYTSAFDYTPDIDFTVGADTIGFNSATAVSRVLKLKKSGNIYYHNHERWEINTVISFNSFAANNTGLFIGTQSTANAGFLQGFQIKAHPSNANLLFIYFISNGSQLTNTGNLAFTNGDDVFVKVIKDRDTYTINLVNQKTFETLTFSEKIGPNLASAYQGQKTNSAFIIQLKQGNFTIRDIEVTQQDINADLLFVGNSITHGSQTTSYYKSYANLVRNKYKNTVVQAGPSSLTSDIIQSLPAIILSKPKKVSLMIGTNDLTVGSGVSLATTQSNYTDIVNTLLNNGIEVVLLSLTPRDDLDIRSFNTWIQSTFPSIQYIDVFPLLADAGTYTANNTYYGVDALHPNNLGHSLIADKILRELNSQPLTFQNQIVRSDMQIDGTLQINKLKLPSTRMGTATLVAGTVTVATTAVATGNIIMLSRKSIGGTIGEIYQPTITNGVSFVITSTSNLDTGTVNWWIIN